MNAVHESHSKEVREGRSLSKSAVAKLYRNESETPEIDRDNTIHNFQVFMAAYPQYLNLAVQAADNDQVASWRPDRIRPWSKKKAAQQIAA